MRCFLSCAFTSVCACMTRHTLHAFKQARPAECTRASSTCAVYLNILNTRASTALHAIPYGHCTPVPVQHSTCPELRSTTDLTRSVWDTTIGIAKYRNVTYWSYEASKRWEISTRGESSFLRFQNSVNTADPVILSSLASKLRSLQPDHQYKFVQEINFIFNEIVQAMTSDAEACNHKRPLCYLPWETSSEGWRKKKSEVYHTHRCKGSWKWPIFTIFMRNVALNIHVWHLRMDQITSNGL